MTLSLARRAERFPDRTAVVDVSEERLYAPAETTADERLTYADLSRLADATAARLAALGVGSGDTVCLLSRNRPVSLALLFACRRLGATFAPISHLLTPVTVERPFAAIDADLVVAESAQRDLVRSVPFDRSVTLEGLAETDPVDDWADSVDDWADPVGARRADRTSAAGADGGPSRGPRGGDRPLLAIHGRGGLPVATFGDRALEHNCLTAVVAWGLSRTDVVPLVSPLAAFDGLVRVALPTLYVGGCLLLDRAFDPGDALTAIADHDATFLAGRPTAFRDLADASAADAFASVDRAVVDGSLDDEARGAFLERGVPIVRAWGRLECPTAFSGPVYGDSAGDDAVGDADVVGPPVPDCRARLVGDGAVVDGPGEGRLELAGPVLADGYVDAERSADAVDDADERTNERSDDHADRGRFADGWFDTGERFRRDEFGRYAPR